jgi:hypothetical protein
MKSNKFRKLIIVLIILAPLFTDLGCKKQPKCGCGKDIVFELTDGAANIYYLESSRTAYFYSTMSTGSTYYFCNPGQWIDSLKKYPQGQILLVTGKAYYECNYLMNSGNYGYYMPPVYQVEVTAIKEDRYGKK